ncbi:hypothetical protein FN846DRAFT_1000392 [Sphaerosporella brunnea]|uniref:Methylated-DNA-[protein]-cysteine S-methyltransferase DNA binding domain-containing protein n=1 Tax=Sphaerosporella brunnea TaxID=1250544 RepID=A0A5J5F4P3_9PEZI|nr:hypothetical protein FN846DRAFT_1000392 [Sphaerosporella brunnea]
MVQDMPLGQLSLETVSHGAIEFGYDDQSLLQNGGGAYTELLGSAEIDAGQLGLPFWPSDTFEDLNRDTFDDLNRDTFEDLNRDNDLDIDNVVYEGRRIWSHLTEGPFDLGFDYAFDNSSDPATREDDELAKIFNEAEMESSQAARGEGLGFSQPDRITACIDPQLLGLDAVNAMSTTVAPRRSARPAFIGQTNNSGRRSSVRCFVQGEDGSVTDQSEMIRAANEAIHHFVNNVRFSGRSSRQRKRRRSPDGTPESSQLSGLQSKPPRVAKPMDDVALLNVHDKRSKRKKNSPSSFTPFQQQVYTLLSQVPAGKVTTIKALATLLGSAPISIGRAIRQFTPSDEFPTIPKHRIVKTLPLNGKHNHTSPEDRAAGEKEGLTIDAKGFITNPDVVFADFDLNAMDRALQDPNEQALEDF